MKIEDVLARLDHEHKNGASEEDLANTAKSIIRPPAVAHLKPHSTRKMVGTRESFDKSSVTISLETEHGMATDEIRRTLAETLATFGTLEAPPDMFTAEISYRWESIAAFLRETEISPKVSHITISPHYATIDKTKLRMHKPRGNSVDLKLDYWPNYKGPHIEIATKHSVQLHEEIVRAIRPWVTYSFSRPAWLPRLRRRDTTQMRFNFGGGGGISFAEFEPTINIPAPANFLLGVGRLFGTKLPLPTEFRKAVFNSDRLLEYLQTASSLFSKHQDAATNKYEPPSEEETARMFHQELLVIDSFGKDKSGNECWPSSIAAGRAAVRMIQEHFGWNHQHMQALMLVTPYPWNLGVWITHVSDTYGVELEPDYPSCIPEKDTQIIRLWCLLRAFRKSFAADPKNSYRRYHEEYLHPTYLWSSYVEKCDLNEVVHTPKPMHADLQKVSFGHADIRRDNKDFFKVECSTFEPNTLSFALSLNTGSDTPFFPFYNSVLKQLGYTLG